MITEEAENPFIFVDNKYGKLEVLMNAIVYFTPNNLLLIDFFHECEFVFVEQGWPIDIENSFVRALHVFTTFFLGMSNKPNYHLRMSKRTNCPYTKQQYNLTDCLCV